ncbi:hypothetical protein EMA8858_00289 [Emticicia aquatica]|jgi:hypothetical protein|uniref:Carboxypeptidase regulatory-like domain-containing protein n=1 Tax=Emticicia aquatica TaxID=1681835 RepID=A0ABM9AL31_9BACT|nr:hypothetical protein [Emticicia aquatica]CAH0994181.1 hypothetical protein EMA8858_00289 [Emticicia aquatica]
MKNLMLIISFLILLFACENTSVELNDVATIEGKVTIGPLCGNVPIIANNSNPCGFSDDQMNLVYSKYKVDLSGQVDGKTITKEVVLNKTGVFTFEVPVGTYKVEVILPEGGSSNQFNAQGSLTKQVSLVKNQTSKVEINVDTGIR